MLLTRSSALLLIPALAWSQLDSRPVPDQSGLSKMLVALDSSALEWRPVEGVPPGATFARLSQDPGTKAAEILIRLPRNYELPMHWHSRAETIVVVEGDLVEKSKSQAEASYGPGSYIVHPAGLLHSTGTPRWHGCLLYTRMDGPFDIFFEPAQP